MSSRIAPVRVLASPLLGACLLACGAARPAPNAATPAAPAAACDPARDRAAVRGMAGEFQVDFVFDEVEALSPGYTVAPQDRSRAYEVVELLEDSDRKVVLQHVLLMTMADGTAAPLKHWRQDWTFEDTELLEFRGHRTFERRALSPAQAACTWSQAVFEVDDAPRYESYGRWVHDANGSTWTSAETWRPLPRREYTKRNDYDVLVATNVHRVTRDGWTHEQDNVKLVLEGNRALAREHGLNTYDRVKLPSAAVAREYLAKTGDFWRGVREGWQHALAREPRSTLARDVDGRLSYEILFELAEGEAPLEQRVAEAATVLDRVVMSEAEARALLPTQ